MIVTRGEVLSGTAKYGCTEVRKVQRQLYNGNDVTSTSMLVDIVMSHAPVEPCALVLLSMFVRTNKSMLLQAR